MEHVVAKNASAVPERDAPPPTLSTGRPWRRPSPTLARSSTPSDGSSSLPIKWREALSKILKWTCKTDSRMNDAPTPPTEEDPFFAFSMADVVPDFGDEPLPDKGREEGGRIVGSGGRPSSPSRGVWPPCD